MATIDINSNLDDIVRTKPLRLVHAQPACLKVCDPSLNLRYGIDAAKIKSVPLALVKHYQAHAARNQVTIDLPRYLADKYGFPYEEIES